MADTPVFQGHHVFEQQAFRDSLLLQELSRRGLFNLDGPRNMLNLPADRALAARLGVSPHPGGPLGDYSEGLLQQLERLEATVDGQAALRGDQAAAQRISTRINGLQDTMKVGMINGDLVSNTPQGMTPEQANRQIRNFFGDLDGYRQRHAAQIADLGRLSANEARWAGVTRSERNAVEAIRAIDRPGMKAVAGDAAAGRQSLGTAVAQAEQSGRLPLSTSARTQLHVAFPQDVPLTPSVRPQTGSPGMPLPEAPPTMQPRLQPAGSPGAQPGVPPEVPPKVQPRGVIEGGVMPEVPGAPGSVMGGRVMRGVGAAGVALMAYDFAVTGHQVIRLQAQGNDTGAASAQTHFVGRNAGGLVGGFLLGAGYGALTGSWTGPGAIATGLVGGVGGAFLGEQWAARKDIERIYTQADRSGNEWTRDPHDAQGTWRRSAAAPNPTGGYGRVNFVAEPHLANQLNYQAANESYKLGLMNPSRPQNPYLVPSAQDQAGWYGGPWQRDTQTGNWSRTLVSDAMPVSEFQVPDMRTERATPTQTADLERQSQLIVAQNASNTPAAMAARYQIAYNQFGWSEFGPVPEAIRNASKETASLQASDGNTYTRGANGAWSTPGTFYGTNPATDRVRDELNALSKSQAAGLQELSTYAKQAQEHPTPPQSRGLRGMVEDAYTRAGVARTAGQIDDATAAVAKDHARDGLQSAPYSLEVRRDGSIATLTGHDDRRLEVKSVTTPTEIAQAHAQREAAPPTQREGAPQTSPPTNTPPTERPLQRQGQVQEPTATPSATSQAFAAPLTPQGDGSQVPGTPASETTRLAQAPDESTRREAPSMARADHGPGQPVGESHASIATPTSPRIDSPDHQQHKLFQQTLELVKNEDKRAGRETDQFSVRLAGAAAAAAHLNGLEDVRMLAFSKDASRMFVSDHAKPDALQNLASVDTMQAGKQSLEVSSAQVAQFNETQASQQSTQQQQVINEQQTMRGPRMG